MNLLLISALCAVATVEAKSRLVVLKSIPLPADLGHDLSPYFDAASPPAHAEVIVGESVLALGSSRQVVMYDAPSKKHRPGNPYHTTVCSTNMNLDKVTEQLGRQLQNLDADVNVDCNVFSKLAFAILCPSAKISMPFDTVNAGLDARKSQLDVQMAEQFQKLQEKQQLVEDPAVPDISDSSSERFDDSRPPKRARLNDVDVQTDSHVFRSRRSGVQSVSPGIYLRSRERKADEACKFTLREHRAQVEGDPSAFIIQCVAFVVDSVKSGRPGRLVDASARQTAYEFLRLSIVASACAMVFNSMHYIASGVASTAGYVAKCAIDVSKRTAGYPVSQLSQPSITAAELEFSSPNRALTKEMPAIAEEEAEDDTDLEDSIREDRV